MYICTVGLAIYCIKAVCSFLETVVKGKWVYHISLSSLQTVISLHNLWHSSSSALRLGLAFQIKASGTADTQLRPRRQPLAILLVDRSGVVLRQWGSPLPPSQQNRLKVTDNINAPKCNTLTILFPCKCKKRYTTAASIIIHIHYYVSASGARHTRASAPCSTEKQHKILRYT